VAALHFSLKTAILQGKIKISIEAGIDQGWHKYIGERGIAIAMSQFGESGSAADLAIRFGFTKRQVLQKILCQIESA
jgi:transketolase